MVQPHWGDSFIAHYNDLQSQTLVQGVITQPPDLRDQYIQITIQSEKIRLADESAGRPVSGLILARMPLGGDWRYGDRIILKGALETPPDNEEFSYKDYLAHQGVYSYAPYASATLIARGQGNRLLAALYALRQRGLQSLYRIFPNPEASLLAGILLGVDANIPASVTQAFRDSGTAHIIAISGFNITIVAGLLAWLFLRLFGRRRRLLAVSLSTARIGFYTLLVGAGPA